MITKYIGWAHALGFGSLALAAQPSAAPPISAPLRDLPWAQLNFLHTTDTHGWHAGHLSEYNCPPFFDILELTFKQTFL